MLCMLQLLRTPTYRFEIITNFYLYAKYTNQLLFNSISL